MRIRATLAALALVTSATTAHAQSGANPVELGVDAQIGFGLDDQGTVISFPLQKVRAGFVVANAMTFEPALGFVRASDDNGSGSSMLLDLSLLYHFSPNRAAKQFYLRPVVGFQRVAFSNDVVGVDEADTYTSIGLAGGLKIPLMSRVATRLEAEFRNQLEHDGQPSQSALNLNFGLSFFTR